MKESDITGKCDQLTQPDELEVLSKYLKEGREQRDEHIIINQDNLEISGRKTIHPLESLPVIQEKLDGPSEVKSLTDWVDTLYDDREIELSNLVKNLIDPNEVKLSEKVDELKVDDAIKELPKQTDSLIVSKDLKLETKLESLEGAKEGVDKLESSKEKIQVDLIKDLSNEKPVKLKGTQDIENLNSDITKLKGVNDTEDLRQKVVDKLNIDVADIYSVRDLENLDQYYNNILTYTDKFAQSYPSASGLTAKIGSLISAYLSGSKFDEKKKEEFEKALFQTLLPILKSSSDWDQLRLQEIKDVDLSKKREKLSGETKDIELEDEVKILVDAEKDIILPDTTSNIPTPQNDGFLDTGENIDGKWKGITESEGDDLDKLDKSTISIPTPRNEGFLDTGVSKDGKWKGITETEKDDLLYLNTKKPEPNRNENQIKLHDWASSIGGGSNQVFVTSFSKDGNNNTLPPYRLGDFFSFWKDGKINANGLNLNDYLRFAAENTVGLIPRSSVRAQRRARALALDEALSLLVVARNALEKTSKSSRSRLPGNEIPGVSSLVSGGALTAAKDLLNAGIKSAAAKGSIDYTVPQNRPTDKITSWSSLSNKSEGTYYASTSDSSRENKRNSLLGILNRKSGNLSKINKLSSRITESKGKLSDINKNITGITQTISSLISRKDTATKSASTYLALLEDSNNRLDKCNTSLTKAQETYNTAHEATEYQRGYYNNAIADRNTRDTAYEIWKANNPGKSSSEWPGWNEYNTSITNASQEKTILEQNISMETDAKNNLKALEEEKGYIESDIESCQSGYDECREEIGYCESEIVDKKSALEDEQGRANELEEEISICDNEINGLKAENNQLDEQEAELESELEEGDDEVNSSSTSYSFKDHYLQGSGINLTLTELCGKNPSKISTVKDLKDAIINSPYMFTPDKITSSDMNNTIVSTLDINNSWEVVLEPYYGNDNGNTSFLPHIEEINYLNRKEHGIKTRYSKYLPITGFDLTKEEYSSKEIGLYSGSFAVPDIMAYKNELRLSFLDDQYKSLRRYFELCAKASTYESNPHTQDKKTIKTEINKNLRFIAPYRNVTFRCVIYSMTPQKSTINKYDLLVVMLNIPEYRSGDIYAASQDLTINFSIVGENPETKAFDGFKDYSEQLKTSKTASDNWKTKRYKSQAANALSSLANKGLSIIT